MVAATWVLCCHADYWALNDPILPDTGDCYRGSLNTGIFQSFDRRHLTGSQGKRVEDLLVLSIQTTDAPRAPGCASNCWYKYHLQLFQSDSIVQ
jgi:hypothetical protein